jgi:hypothetical protein
VTLQTHQCNRGCGPGQQKLTQQTVWCWSHEYIIYIIVSCQQVHWIHVCTKFNTILELCLFLCGNPHTMPRLGRSISSQTKPMWYKGNLDLVPLLLKWKTVKVKVSMSVSFRLRPSGSSHCVHFMVEVNMAALQNVGKHLLSRTDENSSDLDNVG